LDPEVPDLAGLVDRAREAIAETADAVAVQHRATGP
jgi:hypothetical protein